MSAARAGSSEGLSNIRDLRITICLERMSFSLKPFKKGFIGEFGNTAGASKGDTWSLDCGSYSLPSGI